MKIQTTAICTNAPIEPSAIDRLNSRINSVSNRVSNITPYEESKTAYLQDSEVSFNKVKDGMVSATCITESGITVPSTIEYRNNEIVVMFEPLEEVATVSISIQ